MKILSIVGKNKTTVLLEGRVLTCNIVNGERFINMQTLRKMSVFKSAGLAGSSAKYPGYRMPGVSEGQQRDL